jgi:hypothetical protein
MLAFGYADTYFIKCEAIRLVNNTAFCGDNIRVKILAVSTQSR